MVIKIMSFEKIKERLSKAETLGDADKIFSECDTATLNEMHKGLEICKAYFGITMRDEYFLSQIKWELKDRK